jgi:RNA polymerase sigma-70 factor (ECF subfamily)
MAVMTDHTAISSVLRDKRDNEERVEAFIRAVYDKHGSYLLWVSTGLLSGDRDQAQDLVQETVLRAWRHADTLDPQADGIRSWLTHVLRNLAIDGHHARQSRPLETTDCELTELPDQEQTDALNTRNDVRKALSELTFQHREILVHVKLLDHSVLQTSQLLGIPPGTVKSRTHLALKALRSILTERGYAG